MYRNLLKINYLLFIILLTLRTYSCNESESVNLEQYEIIPQDSLLTWLQEGRMHS